MTFPEFFRYVKGFQKRQEMEWHRTYRLWRVQLGKDAPSFDEFMGRERERELTDEEILEEWERFIG